LGEWCKNGDDFCASAHLNIYGPKLFSSLSRSCFTAFRCLTEGCNSYDGTPLLLHVYEASWAGSAIVGFYVLAYLAVTFGLFNLILGVFVESTMESAKNDERKRRRMQGKEHLRVAKKLQRFVLRFCKTGASTPTEEKPEMTIQSLARGLCRICQSCCSKTHNERRDSEFTIGDGLNDVVITRETFKDVISAPEAQELLDDMDVNVMDHMSLFDALDADGSGSLDIHELISGIMQLRGAAEKTDVVASVLKLRSLQQNFNSFMTDVMDRLDHIKQVHTSQHCFHANQDCTIPEQYSFTCEQPTSERDVSDRILIGEPLVMAARPLCSPRNETPTLTPRSLQ